MTLCAVMVSDFMDGTGRQDECGDELYSDSDLAFGVEYADWLISDGFKNEPFYGFSLARFRVWCLRWI